jgi:phenylacetate-CoA ligase
MPLRRLATKAYWDFYTLGYLRAESHLPFAPIDEVIKLQNRRIRSIVSFAYATVPYYREVMDDAGLRPDDFRTADDLARLPLLEGREVARTPDRFVSAHYRMRRGLSLDTSGTSGIYRTIHWSPAALFGALAAGRRQRIVLSHFVDRKSGYREVVLARRAATTDKVRGFYEMNSWVPGFVDLTRLTLSADQPFGELIDQMDEFRPDVVMGYGCHLGALYRWARHNRDQIHKPRAIVFGAEAMPEYDRSLIEKDHRVPVLAVYEAVEALRTAFQCELRKGYHISLDQVALRVVDDAGQTLPAGSTGHVVLSNLTNRGTVLLNYKLGDLVTLGTTPCPCGRSLPVIEQIEGRSDDLIVMPSGEATPALVFLAPLRDVGGTSQLQLEQEALRHFTIRAVPTPGVDRADVALHLQERLKSSISNDIDVTVEWYDTIPPGPSGKVTVAISRVPQPE